MPKVTEQKKLINGLLILAILQLGELEEEEIGGRGARKNAKKWLASSFMDRDAEILEETFLYIEYVKSSRYLNGRRHRISKPSETILRWTLNIWKHSNQRMFREQLRVEPDTFDAIVAILSLHPVFQNNSPNEQVPVGEQIAIGLRRLGSNGNRSSLTEIGLWSGRGHGTIHLITRRVITAICAPNFRTQALRKPSEDEKEASRVWSEAKSCEGWRGGWCGVDGTLVPLHECPMLYGSTWFDRKSNYSTNVQIVSLLHNMRIFDISVGLPGSVHDATAWKETAFYQRHEEYLSPGEWIWADSAYPLQEWVVAPYKSPEKYTQQNMLFNERVSAIRVRSEHAIGYLKGRCASLKSLRISIRKKEHIRYMVGWIVAAICVHNFALDHENMEDYTTDRFFWEGCQDELTEDREEETGGFAELVFVRRDNLTQGKAKREHLKEILFDSM